MHSPPQLPWLVLLASLLGSACASSEGTSLPELEVQESSPLRPADEPNVEQPAVEGVGEGPPDEELAREDEALAWRSTTSGSGAYEVSWRPIPDPILTGEPFQIAFRVLDAEGQALPPTARVFPDAAMPMHGHGMTRRPVAERQADGSFLARGMLFHMAGEWLLSFDIQDGVRFDRATFPLILDAGEAFCEGCDDLAPERLARILELSPLPPPPADPSNAWSDDPRAAHLGQFLFFDERLSGDGSVSCASCHLPDSQWDDGKRVGDVRGPLLRNTPALWNVAYGRWFFWDGQADTLWSQALKPLEDEREHAGDRLSYARLIASDPELRSAYTNLFGELPELGDAKRFPPAARPVPGDRGHPHQVAWESMSSEDQEAINRVFVNLGKSIAAYERLLVSNDSAFDRFVRGLREDDPELRAALSESARRGLDVFLDKGACHNCHSGPNFTDREFHNTRLPKFPGSPRDGGRFSGLQLLLADPFVAKGPYADDPESRKRAAEKLDFLIVSGDSFAEFKTPTLRNVAHTGPYMHNGQFETLEEVIEFYSDDLTPPNVHAHQERVLVPAELNAEEKADLLAFLHALTDDQLPPELLEQPASPQR